MIVTVNQIWCIIEFIEISPEGMVLKFMLRKITDVKTQTDDMKKKEESRHPNEKAIVNTNCILIIGFV